MIYRFISERTVKVVLHEKRFQLAEACPMWGDNEGNWLAKLQATKLVEPTDGGIYFILRNPADADAAPLTTCQRCFFGKHTRIREALIAELFFFCYTNKCCHTRQLLRGGHVFPYRHLFSKKSDFEKCLSDLSNIDERDVLLSVSLSYRWEYVP